MNETELEKINNDLLQKLKNICDELNPYFDSVQIFTTKHEGNKTGTTEMNWGVGNWFARYGQIKQWVDKNSQDEGE